MADDEAEAGNREFEGDIEDDGLEARGGDGEYEGDMEDDEAEAGNGEAEGNNKEEA